MTFDFSHLTNWEILEGSHDTAGMGGGCVNETAIVASGRPYQRISSPHQMPPDFSRVLCGFAMIINDHAPHHVRQRLKAYVTRLPGVADSPEVERLREDSLMRSARRIWNPAVAHAGCGCVACGELGVVMAAGEVFRSHGAWDAAFAALDEAMAIGKQPDPLDGYVVANRLEAAVRTAPGRRSPSFHLKAIKDYPWIADGPDIMMKSQTFCSWGGVASNPEVAQDMKSIKSLGGVYV